jgi:hypothetical protein
MSDEDQAKQRDESKQRREDEIRQAGKNLASQGFSKDQIAAQLSSKFQITVDDAKALVDDKSKGEDA